MTKDYIISIAREVWGDDSGKPWSESALLHLERFAALFEAKVRADEREACANVCEAEGKRVDASWVGCAAAIRARGKK
jgi:hypothetical protein